MFLVSSNVPHPPRPLALPVFPSSAPQHLRRPYREGEDEEEDPAEEHCCHLLQAQRSRLHAERVGAVLAGEPVNKIEFFLSANKDATFLWLHHTSAGASPACGRVFQPS